MSEHGPMLRTISKVRVPWDIAVLESITKADFGREATDFHLYRGAPSAHCSHALRRGSCRSAREVHPQSLPIGPFACAGRGRGRGVSRADSSTAGDPLGSASRPTDEALALFDERSEEFAGAPAARAAGPLRVGRAELEAVRRTAPSAAPRGIDVSRDHARPCSRALVLPRQSESPRSSRGLRDGLMSKGPGATSSSSSSGRPSSPSAPACPPRRPSRACRARRPRRSSG